MSEVKRYTLGSDGIGIFQDDEGEYVMHADHLAATAELRRELEEVKRELAEVAGCLDYGAIAAGRATVLSEVQRTISVLRETQHAKDQQRIAFESKIDTLKREVEELRGKLRRAEKTIDDLNQAYIDENI